MPEKLILQISIPFCFKRCSYCSYPFCAYDPSVLRSYVDALITEIEVTAPEMQDYEVCAISLEGGSPVLAGPEGLRKILFHVKKAFRCSGDLQIRIQTMPGDYSRALMDKMRDMGVNHWIVGLQTPQFREHELLDRSYKFDAITMVDMALQNFHPRALSFDLLYGIPGQTLHSWQQTLERTLAYEPDHMTLYPLLREKGTPLAEKFPEPTGTLTSSDSFPGQTSALAASSDCPGRSDPAAGSSDRPEQTASPAGSRTSFLDKLPLYCSPEEAAAYYSLARDLLTRKGLIPYTIYDFARPGCQDRFRLEQLKGTAQQGLGYRSSTMLDGIAYTCGHSLQEYLDHSDDLSITAKDLVRPDAESLRRLQEARKAQLL